MKHLTQEEKDWLFNAIADGVAENGSVSVKITKPDPGVAHPDTGGGCPSGCTCKILADGSVLQVCKK